MKNSLYLIPFLLLSCATKRDVKKNTDIQKKDSVAVVKENTFSKDSTSAKISKINNSLAFDLEPVNGTEARFVYVVGKDTVRVMTTGKLKVRDRKEKVDEVLSTVSQKDETKDNTIKVNSYEKKKDVQIEKKNNAFQFVLIGMLIVIVVQLLWKQVKSKLFI
jgi:hypothetical protein